MEKRKTFILKKENVERKWYLIDAEGKTLGRIATKIAMILRGKEKSTYTAHVDCGDFVVVINSDKVKTTGKKLNDKVYRKYSGYPGGLKEVNLIKQMSKDSRKVILNAVGGMLPKSRLANKQLTKCKVYKGGEHAHSAQKPIKIEL